MAVPIGQDLRKLLAFGSGVGIEIGPQDLEVVAVRVRPSRVQVVGYAAIENYVGRPAGEWGSEYATFLKSAGMSHVSATVLLPRRDVIVRQLALPAMAAKDRGSAIRLQLDSLHPYGDAEVSWDWTPVAANAVLVGIARRDAVERYAQLFAEAGVAVAAFTFSAAAIHAAIRLNGGNGNPENFLALRSTAAGFEAYGESTARPVFSAEFSMPAERAAALALAELRLPPGTEPQPLEKLLPSPAVNPVENDLSRNALPYATALAGACPRLAPAANVLPPEQRRSSSRAMFIPTVALAVLVVLGLAVMAGYSRYADRQYLAKIQAEISKLEPQARRAGNLDREVDAVRARSRLLDQFRGQTRADLDVLNEVTKLLAPPAWSNSIDITRDQARISGEAPQAAPLLKLLDSSPLFENSEFVTGIGRAKDSETFQIRTKREGRP